MIWLMVILAGAMMLILAVFMALVLGWANDALHVEVDPRVDQVNQALPGVNCGGCGFIGCNEYAEAVVAGKARPDLCIVGGAGVAEAVARIMGVELEISFPYRAVVHCGATYDERLGRGEYLGEPTCSAANILSGVQGCTYGCLGMGDCVVSCNFDAIHMVNGLAIVDYTKCVGCGACERTCPRHIISMVPFKAETMLVVRCSNHDLGKDVKAVCKVGCTGCGLCAKNSGLFTIEDRLARIDYDKYAPDALADALKAMEKCPMKRIVYMGRPSQKDLDALAGEKAPLVAHATFDTTVDKTEWKG